MAKQIYRILDDLSPSEAKLRNLPRKPDGLMNMSFNEYGQLEKRLGYAKYNTTSIGAAHKITGMHRFYKMATSSKEFIVAWNTDLYKIAETTPWGATSIKASLTADSDTYFADFYNHCYIVNGADAMMKYNMTNVRTVGMTVPGAPTGASNIDGSLTEGIYYYKYTFVDEDGYESNGGTASAAITALAHANDGITLTIANSADAKVAKRRIYRTTSGGVVYYYEGEVADNTTTTFASTIADATLALNTVLHVDHDAPPADPHLIAKRRNRLYLGHDSELCISHLSDRDYFPSDWFIYTGSRQKIRGLMEARADLAILTDDTLERLVNYDEDSFEMVNAFSTEGCIAMRSLVNCDNLVCYLGFDGIYYFDGVMSRKLNHPLNEYIKDNINPTYASLSCGTYWDDKYILSYPTNASHTLGASAVPNETIYYDFVNRNYGIYSLGFSCYSKWDKGNDGLQLKSGSNTIGQIYSVFTGTTDDTGAITCYDKPEGLDFGIPERLKNYYSIYVKCKTTTGTGLKVYYQVDDESETSVDTAENAVTANKDRWYRFRLPSGVRGRMLKIRPYISDAYNITFKGYMIEYDVEELQS